MISRWIKILISAIVLFNLQACSHDEAEVRDEQRKEAERRRQQEKNELAGAVGTYRGSLTINGISHNLMIIIGTEPLNDGTPQLTAQVRRTDIVFGRNSVLSGTYTSATGDLYLTNKSSDIGEWDTSGIEGTIRSGQLIGDLKQSGSTLGQIELVRISTSTKVENFDRCHEFYSVARSLMESLSGKYYVTFAPDHGSRPPMTTDLFIRPHSNPYSLALMGSIPSGVTPGTSYEVSYVPYYQGGTMYLYGIAGSNPEVLTMTVTRTRTNATVFKGRFQSNTGRGGEVIIEKDTANSEPVQICENN